MSAIIEVKNLVKKFDELVAVDELSFTVNAADVYGLLGQNGAGKSVTIRMLLSLIEPSSGEVEIFGKPLKLNRHDILKQVGAVIERPDLYKYLTGLENLSIFAKMSGIKVSRTLLMEQLELVGLADRARSKVRTYSQGMKQRLGIAIALVHDPKLVVLDEPTNGLDPQGIADMRNLILWLSREQHKTVLVSSHLLSEMEQVATRMLIIDKGRKIVEGSVTELFHQGNNKVHIKVVQVEKAWQLINELNWELKPEKTENELGICLPPDRVPTVIRYLVENGIDILNVHSLNSLEEYFLSLTAGKQHVAAFRN